MRYAGLQIGVCIGFLFDCLSHAFRTVFDLLPFIQFGTLQILLHLKSVTQAVQNFEFAARYDISWQKVNFGMSFDHCATNIRIFERGIQHLAGAIEDHVDFRIRAA